MKTLKAKSIIVSCIAAVLAILGSSNFTYAQTSPVYTGSAGLDKTKTAINKDLASINQQQQRVDLLQTKLMDEHKAKQATCDTRADLRKANADLDRLKVYLKEDKAELLNEHQAYIAKQKSMVNDDKVRIRELRSGLAAQLYQGSGSAVLYTQEIVNRKHDLKQHEASLKQAITEKNDDLLATNKNMRLAKAESPVTLAFEDSYAKTQNSVMK